MATTPACEWPSHGGVAEFPTMLPHIYGAR
jgi:hypothetical protein